MENTPRWLNKKSVIVGLLFLSLLLAFNWARSHSYIEVTAENVTDGQSITYSFTDQNSGEVTTMESSEPRIKKLVSSGDYEILVTQQETSFIALISTGKFLGTTEVSAQLHAEKARSFVGNEPEPCMYYGDLLYSYDCNQEFSTLKAHLPATLDNPTYTTLAEGDNALIKGLAIHNSAPFMFIEYIDGAEVNGATYAFYALRGDLALVNTAPLHTLAADGNYLMLPYAAGFLVYNDSFSDIQYYNGVNQPPETINIDRPSEDVNLPIALSVSGSQIGALFNSMGENKEGIDITEDQESDKPKGKSEFLLHDKGATKRFKFNVPYVSGRVCGSQKICLTGNNILDVYDVSGKMPKRIFSVNDALETFNIDETLLIVTNQNILALDTESLTGSIQYSFADYVYCGMQVSGSRYVVCVEDETGKSSALLIDPSKENTDNIDKKVFELKSAATEIESISIYDKFIYISPNIGETVYNPATSDYGPDPAKVQAANQAINQKVDEVGIDRSRYTIINPYQ